MNKFKCDPLQASRARNSKRAGPLCSSSDHHHHHHHHHHLPHLNALPVEKKKEEHHDKKWHLQYSLAYGSSIFIPSSPLSPFLSLASFPIPHSTFHIQHFCLFTLFHPSSIGDWIGLDLDASTPVWFRLQGMIRRSLGPPPPYHRLFARALHYASACSFVQYFKVRVSDFRI